LATSDETSSVIFAVGYGVLVACLTTGKKLFEVDISRMSNEETVGIAELNSFLYVSDVSNVFCFEFC
jgi:hypothetical protein